MHLKKNISFENISLKKASFEQNSGKFERIMKFNRKSSKTRRDSREVLSSNNQAILRYRNGLKSINFRVNNTLVDND